MTRPDTRRQSGSREWGASNLDFTTGQTRANRAIVPLGTDCYGGLDVHNGDVYSGASSGSVQFVLDPEGYFATPVLS